MKRDLIRTTVGAVVLLAGVAYFTAPSDPTERIAAAQEHNERGRQAARERLATLAVNPCDGGEYLVGIRAKDAVRETLHDPGSLRNWQMDQFPLDGPDCFYRAQGTFTATNAFGGRVQGSFVADVLAQGLTAQVVGLEVR